MEKIGKLENNLNFGKKTLWLLRKNWKFEKKIGNSEENFGNLENLKLEIDNWIIDLT